MEAAVTATKIDSIMNERGEPSPHQRFYVESPAFEKHLKLFGQVGVVTLKPGRSIKAKLEDRGNKCLFLGYAANHAGNVYRILISRQIKSL